MKKLYSLVFGLLLVASPLYTQPPDPLNWTEPIVVPGSIYVLWGGGESANSLKPMLEVFSGTIGELRSDSLNTPVARNSKMTLSVVDIDNTGIDAVFGAWEGDNSSVELFLINPNNHIKIPVEGTLIGGNGEHKRIFIVPGDYNGNKKEEFVLAFVDADQHINIMLYGSDGNNIELFATTKNEELTGNSLDRMRFSVISGDFSNDGKDEIALIYYDETNDPVSENGLYINFYDYDGNAIVPKAKNVILTEESITESRLFSLNQIEVVACAVPGYGKRQDIIAVALTTLHNSSPNYDDTFLQLVRPGLNLESIIFDASKQETGYNNPNFLPSIALASGDINNDGSAELVFIRSGSFELYSTDGDLNLSRQKTGGFPTGGSSGRDELEESYDYIAITNVDETPGKDLVIVKNIYSDDWENPFPQGFNMNFYGVTDGDLTSFGLKSSSENLAEIPYDWPNRSYALAAGNFENSSITIQAPRHHLQSGVSQPIVILNSPPLHFDIFDEEIFDINNCFAGGPCYFSSRYTTLETKIAEVTTEIKSSWSVSAGRARSGSVSVGATLEAAPLGVGGTVSVGYSENFEYHLLGEYGENFEYTNTRTETQTIHIAVTATSDDQIFSTITDYNVWEYPYFIGNNTREAGVIVAMEPTRSEAIWYPSKSASGHSYRPGHEVGNILSYSPYDNITDNPDIFQEIQPLHDISTPVFTLGAINEIYWDLTWSNFEKNQAYEEIRYGVDAGFMGFGYKAQYNQSDAFVYTQSTSVSDDIKLTLEIDGGLDRSIGPTEYRIRPFAYWSNQGALVLDYSVEPLVDMAGGSTWWQERYGNKPDLTMILPWRHDPEKGYAINDESKRQQTTDLYFSPARVSAGDTVRVTANIRNFSLINSPSDVKVRFYLGDPAGDGDLVADIDGNTEFLTDGPVPSRGVKTISFIWVYPHDLSHSRMYMVIDPDNEIDEIHESNNTGWMFIQGSVTTAITESPETVLYENLELFQNYPNPFNVSSKIDYHLVESDVIMLQVYNMSGKLLQTFFHGIRRPGRHSIEINGASLKPGVYVYIIRGEISGSKTGKMMIMR